MEVSVHGCSIVAITDSYLSMSAHRKVFERVFKDMGLERYVLRFEKCSGVRFGKDFG